MARTRFRVRPDGSIVAPPEVWGYVGRKASEKARRDRENGHRVDLLLEFIEAAAEAQRAQFTRDTVVPSPEPAEVPPARVELTPAEVAERLGCSAEWVRRLCSAKRIPAHKVSGIWVIYEDDIDRPTPRRTT